MTRIPPFVPNLDYCISQAPRPHTFTYCTVTPSGIPSARTCVFRSWLFNDKSTGVLLFTTDRRSRKVVESSNYSACFYFPNSSMQFRLSGFAQALTLTEHPTLVPKRDVMKDSGRSSTSSSGDNSGNSTPTASIDIENDPFPTLLATPPSSVPHQYQQKQQQHPAQFDQQQQQQQDNADDAETLKLNHSCGEAYPLYSPAWLDQNDIYTADSMPPAPTPEEWRQEYLRIWDSMQGSMKSSFRRPPPGTPLTEEKAHLIDKISRGVDGSSDESGQENFVVMVMFVNSADLLLDRLCKRFQYQRVEGTEWIEQEVCP